MPLIIGTAGHIDHGKTSLIRALTGQDTDRLKEEKERGISIDLGFAYLDADGERAGIVDVPGHERFIRNMLAGAHGIDLVLFTVAADDGVMPQTEEHLDILHLLGVRRGIFVITKTDLVDAPRVAAVREEIEILTLDTTLEGAPIIPVSTVTGEGLDLLRGEIAARLAAPPGPAPPGYFRMPVDRAFVMRGHGVVVTGTAIAGTVSEGDAVRVLPGAERARVRSLESHGVPVRSAGHGQRVAMNLAGVEREDLGRGDVVCDERLELAPEFASDLATVGQALNLREEEARAALAAAPAVVPIPEGSSPEAYTTEAMWRRLGETVVGAVAAAHREQPLAPGLEMESLRTGLPWDVPPRIFRCCIDRLVAAGRLVREESVVRSPEHRVRLGAEARALGERVERLLAEGRFTPPDLRQIEEATGVGRSPLGELLGVLESEGRITRIAPDLYS